MAQKIMMANGLNWAQSTTFTKKQKVQEKIPQNKLSTPPFVANSYLKPDYNIEINNIQ